jgi:tetratricopeptide (TPR) repeat protein
VEFRILGPVGVLDEEGRSVMNTTKRLDLLALLLASPNQRASHEEVTRCLWPGNETKHGAIRQCVRNLRLDLPSLDISRNAAHSCGIKVPSENVDYLRSVSQLQLADTRVGAEKVRILRAALQEWHDEGPLQGLRSSGFVEVKARLDRERLDLSIAYLRAMLDIDDAQGVLAEIDGPRRRWPGDARLLELALRATSRCRSESDAVSLIREWTEAQGEPSTSLRALFEEVTRSVSARPSSGASHHWMTPRQLPRSGQRFTGRQAQLDELSSLLLDERRRTGRLVVLSGMAGVGKTRLACHWGASNENLFPDGTLYEDLHGFTWDNRDPESSDHVLSRFLKELGVELPGDSLEAKATAYRSALAERSMLIVLDNARSAEQVRPLIPGSGRCATLITSRDRLHGIEIREEAHVLEIEPLSPEDAVAFLSANLGQSQQRSCGHLFPEAVELCGRLPLTLRVLAARIGNHPLDAVRKLLEELRDEQKRLNALGVRGNDLCLRLALDCSRRSLSPSADQLLWQLGVHAGPSISWSAMADLVLVDPGADVDRAVDELLDAHLLSLVEDRDGSRRYVLHDLVRIYAQEVADQKELDLRKKTVRRASEYLLQNAWVCDQALVPERNLPIHAPGADVAVAALAHETEAMAWFDSEYATVKATIWRTESAGEHQYTWLLAMVLVTYQWRRHLYADALVTLKMGLAAAGTVVRPCERAMVHRMIAGTFVNQKQYELARNELQAASRASDEDDELGLAHALNGLAIIDRHQHRKAEALDQFERALAIFRRLGFVLGEAVALNGISGVRRDTGAYDEALEYGQEALRVFETTSDRNGHADALRNLGEVHLSRGEGNLAIPRLRAAADIYRRLSYHRNEASALRRLALALTSVGQATEAREASERADRLLRALPDKTTGKVAKGAGGPGS